MLSAEIGKGKLAFQLFNSQQSSAWQEKIVQKLRPFLFVIYTSIWEIIILKANNDFGRYDEDTTPFADGETSDQLLR